MSMPYAVSIELLVTVIPTFSIWSVSCFFVTDNREWKIYIVNHHGWVSIRREMSRAVTE